MHRGTWSPPNMSHRRIYERGQAHVINPVLMHSPPLHPDLLPDLVIVCGVIWISVIPDMCRLHLLSVLILECCSVFFMQGARFVEFRVHAMCEDCAIDY